MIPSRTQICFVIVCAAALATLCRPVVANTLCVNPHGSHGCFSKIQTAVNNASTNDVIEVATGTYAENVVIGIPLSLIGAVRGRVDH